MQVVLQQKANDIDGFLNGSGLKKTGKKKEDQSGGSLVEITSTPFYSERRREN